MIQPLHLMDIYEFRAIPYLPLWKKASKTALLALSVLSGGTTVRDGREITVTFSPAQRLAIVKMRPVTDPPLLKVSLDKGKEPVAKFASRFKFDDFKAGSVFSKSTYPIGHGRLAKNRIRRRERGSEPEWSVAIGSKVNPFPICSESDKLHILDLLATLDEATPFSLGIKMFRLAEIGDRIAHLHPMTFIKIVFNDSALRDRLERCFKSSLKRLGMMNGSYFREGFNHQLNREAERGTLEPNMNDFASSLRVDPEEIRPLIRSRAWTDLYDYLLKKTVPQKA